MQTSEQSQQLMVQNQNSGSLSFNSNLSREDEEMSRSALSTFKAKEEEIERKRMEVREKVQAQLGRVEEETKRLATIREELEGLADPMRKEVAMVRKKIDAVNKELKPLGHTCQKKEKEYKDALEAFNDKNKEKVQLITKLMELVSDSEKMRLKKLEELKDFELFICLLWGIWTNINKVFHGGKSRLSSSIITYTTGFYHDFSRAKSSSKPVAVAEPSTTNSVQQQQIPWFPPSPNGFKLNVDVATNFEQKKLGIGAILRDHDGMVVAALSKVVQGSFRSDEMEAKSLFHALNWASQLQLSITHIETDALRVSTTLKSATRLIWKVGDGSNIRILEDHWLPHNKDKDEIVWEYDSSGIFSVKSAYHLAFSHQDLPSTSSPDNSKKFWSKIWTSKIPPKVKIFIWRLLSQAIPVAFSLYKKCILDSPLCPLCKIQPETAKHALLDCSRSRKAWKHSRNNLFHNKFSLQPVDVYDWSVDFFFKYMDAQQVSSTQQVDLLDLHGLPAGVSLQLFTDAAIDTSRKRYSIGAVVMNSSNQVIAGFVKPFEGCVSPVIAEAKAILQALQWVTCIHLPVDVLKTDCKSIVDK
uniref:RAB6-interacting golgin n=1 Tax=Cannabis sativa TaxID=3483 RepID=A0A803P5C9_CANSA